MSDNDHNSDLQPLQLALKRLGTSIAANVIDNKGQSTPACNRSLEPNRKRRIDAGVDIALGEPGDILFQHTILCQCSMPYRDPGFDQLKWTRRNGNSSLHITAGDVEHPDGEWRPVGLPFGPKPRLILMHLNGEALRQQSPYIEIDQTLTRFVRRIGLPSKGKNITSVKEHVAKLAAAEIRMSGQSNNAQHRTQRNMHIVDGFDLWFPKQEGQRVLWPGHVELGNEYFQSLISHAVPMSEKAISGLRNNTMALDIYAWLAQRLHRVNGHQGIPWPNLHDQFGQGYKALNDFKKAFRRNVAKVQEVYPDANIKLDYRGAQLRTSRPPIAKRLYQIPHFEK